MMNSTMEGNRSKAQSAPWRMHEFFAGSGLVSYTKPENNKEYWINKRKKIVTMID